MLECQTCRPTSVRFISPTTERQTHETRPASVRSAWPAAAARYWSTKAKTADSATISHSGEPSRKKSAEKGAAMSFAAGVRSAASSRSVPKVIISGTVLKIREKII